MNKASNSALLSSKFHSSPSVYYSSQPAKDANHDEFSNHKCDSILRTLIVTSDFLEKAKVPEPHYWRKKILNKELTLEIQPHEDTNKIIINIYSPPVIDSTNNAELKEYLAPSTLSWVTIDLRHAKMYVSRLSDGLNVSVKHSKKLLKLWLDSCL